MNKRAAMGITFILFAFPSVLIAQDKHVEGVLSLIGLAGLYIILFTNFPGPWSRS